MCDRHHLYLLSNCPVCKTGFQTPALWGSNVVLGDQGEYCECCGLGFTEMQSDQQPVNCGDRHN